jgi:hypothetical protein
MTKTIQDKMRQDKTVPRRDKSKIRQSKTRTRPRQHTTQHKTTQIREESAIDTTRITSPETNKAIEARTTGRFDSKTFKAVEGGNFQLCLDKTRPNKTR